MTVEALLALAVMGLAIADVVKGVNSLVTGHEARVEEGVDRAFAICAARSGQCAAEIAIELGRPGHQIRSWLEAEGIDHPDFCFTPATYGRPVRGLDDD